MHTPTPWHLGNFREVKDTFYAKPDNVDSIGMIFCSNRTPEGAHANAAFIVRAVNNHEALVEALEAIEARINGDYDCPALIKYGSLNVVGYEDVLTMAQKALAAAKGDAC